MAAVLREEVTLIVKQLSSLDSLQKSIKGCSWIPRQYRQKDFLVRFDLFPIRA
jgi:hypothetical protein